MTTVRKEWESYRRTVLPATAPAIQLQESRRAFYAGAEMLMCAILRSLDPSPDAVASDMALIAALDAELRQFATDVQQGRA
jgi:hypothetical protein